MKAFFYHFIQEDQKNFFARIFKGFLWVLSFVYLGLLRFVLWLYQSNLLKRKYLSRPVISIGNLTVGGTGKTPLAGFVAAYLKRKGFEPVILIRGYMAKNGISDEVELYKEIFPGIHIEQGQNRFEAGLKTLTERPRIDAFILDDGFQHWPLNRDVDIVVIDATNPFGNGFCLPRGTLREPLSALKRADIIIITKVDLAKEHLPQIYATLKRNNFHAIFAESVYEPMKLINLKDKGQDKDISTLKNSSVALFSAIGNPQSFEKTVRALGAHVQRAFSFSDHHFYTKADLQKMIHEAQVQNITMLITTQKDAVKLQGLLDLFPKDIELFALAISMKIVKGEKEFEERIHTVLQR
jgi:tetraacyldisaccharide 4'-kinase